MSAIEISGAQVSGGRYPTLISICRVFHKVVEQHSAISGGFIPHFLRSLVVKEF